jgi:hypothetical protein
MRALLRGERVTTDGRYVKLEGWGDASTPEFGVAGNADVVAKAVERLADAGADTVVLQPTADEPDLEGFLRFVAHESPPTRPLSAGKDAHDLPRPPEAGRAPSARVHPSQRRP